MTRNQALLIELTKSIEEIKRKIRLKNENIYHAELNQLHEIVQQSLVITTRSSYFEKNNVVKYIMKMINDIEHDIESIEIEMRGVGNYSGYECSRVADMLLKQTVRDDLDAMLHLIIQARPEIRDNEIPGIMKIFA